MSGNGINSPFGLVRTLQIIVAALIVGCGMFMAIVLVVAGSSSKVADPPVITYIALAMAAGAVAARLIIPGIIVAQARRRILSDAQITAQGQPPARKTRSTEQNNDTSKLIQMFLVKTIVAAAILEGAAFFSLIAHLVEHSPLSLYAAIVLIVALAAHFPTQARVDGWIDDQTRLLDEERQLDG
jgi:hypothetical protein